LINLLGEKLAQLFNFGGFMYSLGVDIAQDKFDVCLFDCKTEKDILEKSYKNDLTGFEECKKDIISLKVELKDLKIYLESTGGLEENFFEYFQNKVIQAYILNAKQVKNFKAALFEDHKTDKIDAKVLARMIVLPGLKNSHKAENQNKDMKIFKAFCKQRDFLVKQRTNAKLRLNRILKTKGNNSPDFLIDQMRSLIETLDKQINEIENEINKTISSDPDLMKSFTFLKKVPSIGNITAFTLMGYLGKDGKSFKNAEKFCAYAGLYPAKRESGKWVGQNKLTIKGNRELRRVLYLCAVSSITRKGKFRSFYESKIKLGKKPMQILICIANKLARLSWSVVYNQTYYDESKFLKNFT
jgi:transposase